MNAVTATSSFDGLAFLLAMFAILLLPHLFSIFENSISTQLKSISSKGDNEPEASSAWPTTTDLNNPVSMKTLGGGDASGERNEDGNDESPPIQSQSTIVPTENQWRCACEGGFLPPGLLQTLGGAEAALRMSTGQCYHKKM
jgi:hypothetical protein